MAIKKEGAGIERQAVTLNTHPMPSLPPFRIRRDSTDPMGRQLRCVRKANRQNLADDAVRFRTVRATKPLQWASHMTGFSEVRQSAE